MFLFSEISPLLRMLFAGVTAFLFTLLFGPRCIKKLYEMKTGQSISVEDCPPLIALHEKKRDTPTMGGVLILSAMILSLFLWMDLSSHATWILLGSTLWMGAIGGYDDYLKLKHKNWKGLGGKKKLLFQLLFSAAVAFYVMPDSLFFPFIKHPLPMITGIGFLLILITITGCSNAVNLTDGLDGLASGCVTLCASVFVCVAYFSGNIEIATYLCAMVGASVGFLWFNGYPAQLFMGDVGSLSLGGILGTTAVLLRQEFLLALVGGIFVAEALSVMLQVGSYKWRGQKRIFLCSPLHHHFQYKGWHETKVVVRFWIVGLLLTLLGMISIFQ